MSKHLTQRALPAIVGAALLTGSAEASARVVNPLLIPGTPSWWTPQGPDPLALLPSVPLEPLGVFPLASRLAGERWYEGEAEVDGTDEATPLTLPCGLFLDVAPHLTLFDDPRWWEPPSATVVAALHTGKQGEVIDYEQVPRRWDRPIDYEAYRYPVAAHGGWASVTSGYDLDRPDAEQRRGTMRAIGHGGLDLPQARGTKVTLIPLAQQVGDARVIHVGALFGNSVVTLHAVREGGERRNYLVIFGHLDSAAPGLLPGQILPANALVGFVGNSEAEFVHLHLEVRRVRDGIDPTTLTGYRALAREATIVTDPRNVLPTKPAHIQSCQERRLAQRRAPLSAELHLELDSQWR